MQKRLKAADTALLPFHRAVLPVLRTLRSREQARVWRPGTLTFPSGGSAWG